MEIYENIKKIRDDIGPKVTIVAATKTREVTQITEAIEGGISIIGENYVREAEAKYQELKGKVQFHCIGHLQANKAKKAVEIFDMIQTVDSARIANEINKRCRQRRKIMPVLIEINSGKESSKNGIMPEDTIDLVKQVSRLGSVRIKGLMTMAPYFEDPENSRPFFRLTKRLFDSIRDLQIPNVDMNILSMGMSDSYKVAVQEGASMVRIGSLIFGER